MKLRSDFLTSFCPAERTQFQLPQQSQSHRTLAASCFFRVFNFPNVFSILCRKSLSICLRKIFVGKTMANFLSRTMSKIKVENLCQRLRKLWRKTMRNFRLETTYWKPLINLKNLFNLKTQINAKSFAISLWKLNMN